MSRVRLPNDLVNVTVCRRDGFIACGTYDPDEDPRLQQDMESELAADVEWYDHPTRGRIRLVDELVHPPGTVPAHAADLAYDPGDDWEPR